jgi:hypothetical protein
MKSNWTTAKASVIGRSHIENELPCQDASRVKRITPNCGVAIVADGAGSCTHSQLGSNFITEKGVCLFAEMLSKTSFIKKRMVLRKDHWRRIVLKCFYELRCELSEYAIENKYNIKELSSTIIVVVYSPWGIMVAHVGDGRAAYMDSNQDWKPLFTPFSGSEAGTTVFFTSEIVWKHPEKFIETSVVREGIAGFTLLSDGMEKSSFECYTKMPDKELYYDPNRPFSKFFNPIKDSLLKMSERDWNQYKINKAWQVFLLKGNERLINEPDDKTMIVSILKNKKNVKDN